MFGLATIRSINAAAAAKGRTDVATHVRVAKNEQIAEDMKRQKKGRAVDPAKA